MERLLATMLQVGADVLPILVVILIFQAAILRRLPADLKRILLGAGYAFAGLVLFRMGLDDTLLPLGTTMAEQLASRGYAAESGAWHGFGWLIGFVSALGLAATLIEPTLLAVANRVQQLSGGELRALDLRLVVSMGVALGLALGCLRIVLGLPLLALVVPMLLLTALLVRGAPRGLGALALDTGPMATSVVTVPLIAAFGSSVARSLPNRDPVLDGFGLVFLALLTPVLCLLAFTGLQRYRAGKSGSEET